MHLPPSRLLPFLAQWDYVVDVLNERLSRLTDEEFRTIKTLLAARLREQLKDTGEKG